MADVRLHCRLADVESLTDPLVAKALGREDETLNLSRRQRPESVELGRWLACRRGIQGRPFGRSILGVMESGR